MPKKIKFEKWKKQIEFVSHSRTNMHAERLNKPELKDTVLHIPLSEWDLDYMPSHGKALDNITCPCCDNRMQVYRWSFYGGGKRCDNCNVVVRTSGIVIHKDELPANFKIELNQILKNE